MKHNSKNQPQVLNSFLVVCLIFLLIRKDEGICRENVLNYVVWLLVPTAFLAKSGPAEMAEYQC